MNARRISKPVTPPDKEYTYREVAAMHPSMRRQVYLDTNQMALWAQTRIHNDAETTIREWMNDLP